MVARGTAYEVKFSRTAEFTGDKPGGTMQTMDPLLASSLSRCPRKHVSSQVEVLLKAESEKAGVGGLACNKPVQNALLTIRLWTKNQSRNRIDPGTAWEGLKNLEP